MAGRRQLEQEVLHMLWEHPDGLTARELIDALDGDGPVMTTMLTVLDRLVRKGLATRRGSMRPRRYLPAVRREEHIAQLMLEALDQAPDRQAALTHFVGAISDTDTRHVRRALRHRGRGPVDRE